MSYEGSHQQGSGQVPFARLKERPPRRTWFRWLLILIVAASLLGGGGVVGSVYLLGRDLPAIDTLRSYEPSQATRVYSDDNQLVGQFFVEKRVFVPLAHLPKEVPQAIIAVEDAHFYEHKGFNPLAMIRAMLANLGSFRIRQGASTITQQLARTLFLTPERTMKRKIKELLLAYRMEKLLAKDEILELYLNQIYFGHGAYGIQVASRTYFGKDARELTLPEAAMLAGLPKAPNDYSPYSHPERAKRRQGVILRRMVEEGYLTEEGYRKAYAQNLFLERPKSQRDVARYFLEYVRKYLVSTYGDDTVYKGGLNVYTTLNLEMQRIANHALHEGLRQLDKRQGYRGHPERPEDPSGQMGRVSHLFELGDIVDGEVTRVGAEGVWVRVGLDEGFLPLEEMLWAFRRLDGPDLRKDVRMIQERKPDALFQVGDIVKVGIKEVSTEGRPMLFSLEQEPEVEGAFVAINPLSGAVQAMVGGYDFRRSEFNRAILARRQPGSAFKPIIYAAAIEAGYTPSSVIVDSPVIYTDPETGKVWKPENYEGRFYGPTTLRDALVHSRNLATVHLLEDVGIRNVIGFSRRVGIQSDLSADLSLALGSSGVSLLELTASFSIFANQGVYSEPFMISSITDANGIVLETHGPKSEQVISRETAYLITNMLVDVIQRGTARRARKLKFPLAGKTGTTNDFTDAWFIGYAPNLAAGIWVGFDDLRSLGDREAGGAVALPIWSRFMSEVLPNLPSSTFPIPEDIVYAKIDPLTGLLAPPGAKNTRVEIFIRGEEPVNVSARLPEPIDFFKEDTLGH